VAEPCPLTRIELEVLQGLADGLRYKQIAQKRGVTLSTIRTQVHYIIGKLGVQTGAQAVLAASKRGWIGPLEEPVTGQVVRLTDATDRLASVLRARQQVTDGQRRYLAAFDALLYASSRRQQVHARRAMKAELAEMLGEPADDPLMKIIDGMFADLRGRRRRA
jgi:DNA-binding CsgD family transcriptional regulator